MSRRRQHTHRCRRCGLELVWFKGSTGWEGFKHLSGRSVRRSCQQPPDPVPVDEFEPVPLTVSEAVEEILDLVRRAP